MLRRAFAISLGAMIRADPLADLPAKFRSFASRECAGISPLYAELGQKIADDAELLQLTAEARAGQPPPNMLFGAVQALMLRHADAPLTAFYASLAPTPRPAAEAFPAFRAFCRDHREAIAGILRARVVSTNEVARCACLLPAFGLVARRAGEPFNLIEIGSSAGLLLHWDRYAYDYGTAGRLGPEAARLTLACEALGTVMPPLPNRLPAVATRLGIDPVPLDPGDPDDRAWLRALVWPEQHARRAQLDAALDIAAKAPASVLAGTAQERLPDAVAGLPRDGARVVFHAFTLNQFLQDQRQDLVALLDRLGQDRPLFRIGLEWGDGAAPRLSLAQHGTDQSAPIELAHCDAHGGWIEWTGPRS